MQATLLGTGCPVAHPARGGAVTMIQDDKTAILIDAGSGTTQRLVEVGTLGAQVDALLLTHLHSDHLVDFYQLVISSWHQGRNRPWKIYGPAPVLRHIEAVMAAWEPERAQRIAFEGRDSVTGLQIDPHEINGGDRMSVGTIDVEVVEVDHAPVVPALGFVFRSGDRTVVHSGDTRRCEALIAAGQNADLLIHEVYLHSKNANVRKTASYHTMSSEVGSVASAMNAKALALTHFVPPEFDRATLLAEVAETYAGPIFVGEDLMQFDLSAGDVAWRDMRAKIFTSC